jgi:hypothetical protein
MAPICPRSHRSSPEQALPAELDSDAEAKAWLVEKISVALEAAEEAGYKTAMRKRF